MTTSKTIYYNENFRASLVYSTCIVAIALIFPSAALAYDNGYGGGGYGETEQDGNGEGPRIDDGPSTAPPGGFTPGQTGGGRFASPTAAPLLPPPAASSSDTPAASSPPVAPAPSPAATAPAPVLATPSAPAFTPPIPPTRPADWTTSFTGWSRPGEMSPAVALPPPTIAPVSTPIWVGDVAVPTAIAEINRTLAAQPGDAAPITVGDLTLPTGDQVAAIIQARAPELTVTRTTATQTVDGAVLGNLTLTNADGVAVTLPTLDGLTIPTQTVIQPTVTAPTPGPTAGIPTLTPNAAQVVAFTATAMATAAAGQPQIQTVAAPPDGSTPDRSNGVADRPTIPGIVEGPSLIDAQARPFADVDPMQFIAADFGTISQATHVTPGPTTEISLDPMTPEQAAVFYANLAYGTVQTLSYAGVGAMIGLGVVGGLPVAAVIALAAGRGAADAYAEARSDGKSAQEAASDTLRGALTGTALAAFGSMFPSSTLSQRVTAVMFETAAGVAYEQLREEARTSKPVPYVNAMMERAAADPWGMR